MQLPNITAIGVHDSSLNTSYRQAGFTPERTTESFEIDLPIVDGGTSFIDDAEYPIRKNIIIFAKPHQRRHTVLPYKCLYVHLTAEGELYERLTAFENIINLSDTKKYEQLYRDMIYIAASNSKNDDMLLQSRLLELLYNIEHDNKLSFGSDGSTIDQALRYIDEHISSNITLDELAAQLYINPTHLHRLFKRALGTTPYRYILNKKLTIAKSQLIMTNKSCRDIARELGFTSQSYFNYTFKKELGISPNQYRREQYERYPE